MEKLKLEKWQKIGIAVCGAGVLCSILLFIPFVQNLALDFGENVLVHRPLTRDVWIERFVEWGKGVFLFFPLSIIIILFWNFINESSISIKNGNPHIVNLTIILFFIISLITFIFTPVTGDIQVFTGSAMQSDFKNSNWVFNVYNTWELKGVFNRLFFYIGYKLVTLFVNAPSYAYEVGIKIFALFNITICAFLTSILVYGNNTKESKKCTILIILAFTTSFFPCHMQAEMICTLICFCSLCLYIKAYKYEKPNRILLFISGLLIGSLFFYKSVLILLSASIVGAVFLLNDLRINKNNISYLFIVVAGSVTMIVIGLVSIFIINPNEIQDMIDAASYQPTLFTHSFSIIQITYNFIFNYLQKCYQIPIISIGTLIFVFLLVKSIKERKYEIILYRILLWGMPILFIILSNCYFTYHFTVLIFPSVIEILVFFKEKKEIKNGRINFIIILTAIISIFIIIISHFFPVVANYDLNIPLTLIEGLIILLCLYYSLKNEIRGIGLVLCLNIFIYCCFMSCFGKRFLPNIKYDIETYSYNSKLSLDNEEICMYLDAGCGAYQLNMQSALKYFFTLPLNRFTEDSPNAKKLCYTETKKAALDFTGKYITVDNGWFFADGEKNVEILDKVNKEYILIGKVAVYSPDWDLFKVPDENSIGYLDLYERN